jgi:hypothetical protein
MGVWFQDPKLQQGEAVEFQAKSNFLKTRRAIGGRITLTGRRLIFMPTDWTGSWADSTLRLLEWRLKMCELLAQDWGQSGIDDQQPLSGVKSKLMAPTGRKSSRWRTSRPSPPLWAVRLSKP